MIYAKIIYQKKNENGSDIIFVHFYGDRPKCEKYSDAVKEAGIHPYALLAMNNFMPITDTLFVLNE